MPMVIPIVIAFASGAVGAVIAGTATFAAYATVAGAVLSTVGALTHNKDLQKIGGFVGLAGGLASLAGAASSAASAAPAVGAAVDETAAETARLAAQEAAAAGTSGAGDAAAGIAANAPATTSPVVSGAPADAAIPPTPPATPQGTMDPVAADAGSMSMAERAAQSAQQAGLATADAGAPASGVVGTTTQLPSGQDLAADSGGIGGNALRNAAKNFDASDLSTWWDKATKAGKAGADWLQKNPTLTKIGADILTANYGPQAEALDLQKSLMERARRNINAPVVLQYKGQ